MPDHGPDHAAGHAPDPRRGYLLDHASDLAARCLRWDVIDRLTLVGRRHARHLTILDHTPDRPGEHILVFLYRPVQRADRGGSRRDPVWVATRMFTHSDILDVTAGRGDLPSLLRVLQARAEDFRAAGAFDPRLHMTNHHDAQLCLDNAQYLGVATSTLVQARGAGGPRTWQSHVQLIDGTELELRVRDIDGHYRLDGLDVSSSTPLAVPHSGLSPRAWHYLDTAGLSSETTTTRAMLRLLHGLTEAPRRHPRSPAGPSPHVASDAAPERHPLAERVRPLLPTSPRDGGRTPPPRVQPGADHPHPDHRCPGHHPPPAYPDAGSTIPVPEEGAPL